MRFFRRRFGAFLVTGGIVLLTGFSNGFAADWYVRPAGGSYGTENGVDYANAWDGLTNVVWGSNGVTAGDSLYVCGLHLHTVSSGNYIDTQADIVPASGSSDSARVTIRGDCPADPGTVWGAYKLAHVAWTNEGGGVWSIVLPGSAYPEWFFQDIGPTSWTVLERADDLTEVAQIAGSFFSPSYSGYDKLYVHLTDGGAPHNRIFANRYGYEWKLVGTRYVTLRDLKLYNPHWFFRFSDVPTDHVRFQNVDIRYGEGYLMHVGRNVQNLELIDSELSWGENGVYTTSTAQDPNWTANNLVVRGNYIHDIGVRAHNGDAHCVGVMGGHGGVVEDNICANAGSGVTIHAWNGQNTWGHVVSRNIISNIHALGGGVAHGIGTWGQEAFTANTTDGIEISNNVVFDADQCFRLAYTRAQTLYNNVGINCRAGIYLPTAAPTVIARNNIFQFDPASSRCTSAAGSCRHVDVFSGVGAVLNFDRNIYHPAGTSDLSMYARLGGGLITLAQWRALLPGVSLSSNAASLFDPNSFGADPRFVNAAQLDFRLQESSPAIDAGEDVGLTLDLAGSAAPKGTAHDIGAYEYEAPIVSLGQSQTLTTLSNQVTSDTGGAQPDPSGTETVTTTASNGTMGGAAGGGGAVFWPMFTLLGLRWGAGRLRCAATAPCRPVPRARS